MLQEHFLEDVLQMTRYLPSPEFIKKTTPTGSAAPKGAGSTALKSWGGRQEGDPNPSNPEATEWECGGCTFLNSVDVAACEMCGGTDKIMSAGGEPFASAG